MFTKINPKYLIQVMSWWFLLSLLTFQIRYFEMYLPKNEVLYRDLKSVMACSGFVIPGFGSDCSVWLYGRYLRTIMSQMTLFHPYATETITVMLCFFLLSLACLIVHLREFNVQMLSFLVFLSPPIALLIQRANVDILIFFLSWISIRLFTRGHLVAGLSISAFATTLKMFPLALFLILFVIVFFKEKSTVYRFFLLTFSLLLIFSTLIDIKNLPWLPSDGRNSFGLRIFGEYVVYLMYGSGNQMFPLLGSLIGGFILIASLLFVVKLRLKIEESRAQDIHESQIWLFFFLSIFVSGISVDYRLVFIFPALSLIQRLNGRGKVIVTVLIIGSFLFSFPFEKLQILGDVCLFLLISVLLVVGYKGKTFYRMFAQQG